MQIFLRKKIKLKKLNIPANPLLHDSQKNVQMTKPDLSNSMKAKPWIYNHVQNVTNYLLVSPIIPRCRKHFLSQFLQIFRKITNKICLIVHRIQWVLGKINEFSKLYWLYLSLCRLLSCLRRSGKLALKMVHEGQNVTSSSKISQGLLHWTGRSLLKYHDVIFDWILSPGQASPALKLKSWFERFLGVFRIGILKQTWNFLLILNYSAKAQQLQRWFTMVEFWTSTT